ncbi:MAG: hypothetical protein AAF962_01285 [Actinomycetota bacterium]
MFDELDELRQIDPIKPEHLVDAVAVDRDVLARAFEADRFATGDGDRDDTELPSSMGRIGYVGAGLLVAACFAGLAFVGVSVLSTDTDLGEGETPTAEAAVTTTTLLDSAPGVVEEVEAGTGGEPQVVEPPADAGPATEPPAPDTCDATVDADCAADAAPTVDPTWPGLELIDGPFDPTTDLLVLHFDNAPSYDDSYAAVASLEISSRLGLEPLVVNGTRSGETDRFNAYSTFVMDAAWGDAYLDAVIDRDGAVATSVERWLAALDGGGSVWVAEGSPSHLTADVLREVIRLRPDVDTAARIHVVQHSDFNEQNTAEEVLAYVQSVVDYQRIDDGNERNNTADLRMASPAFEEAALAGRHGDAWAVAFDLFGSQILDFSDAVTLLHIVGVDVNEVADSEDFARVFIS